MADLPLQEELPQAGVGETLEEEVEVEVEAEEGLEAGEEQAPEVEAAPNYWEQNLKTSLEIAWTSTVS